MDRHLTLVELGRHERSRQSLIFGSPLEIIPCPYGYKLAVFESGQSFGYERWKANDYGTTSWQFWVLKTGPVARLNQVSGIYPGADILFQVRGKEAVQRTLNWVKRIRRKDGDGLAHTPELSWRRLANERMLRREFPKADQFLQAAKS